MTEMMSEYFKEIVDVDFTANMEEKLDDIEVKGARWKDIIEDYYGILEGELKRAYDEAIEIDKEPELTGDVCEICGKPMALKHGRYGDFIACTGYPECKNTKPIVETIGVKCPECGGDLIVKRSKRGRVFYGCSNFPKCRQAYWDKPVDKKCPECGSLLVEKKTKDSTLACSNKECNYKE